MSVTPTVEHRGSARELLGVQPPPKPWAEMTRDEREMHMVANVLPIAAESFGGYDASRYAQFQCTSCHGDDAEAVHYALPTRFLPRLPAPGSEAWNTMAASPAFRFMAEHVVPDTARMIGQEPYNPATHQGFGCFGCHMGSGDAAATAAPATAPVAPAAAPTAPARGTRRTRHP